MFEIIDDYQADVGPLAPYVPVYPIELGEPCLRCWCTVELGAGSPWHNWAMANLSIRPVGLGGCPHGGGPA